MDKLYLYYSLESLIKDFYKESHGSGMVHITKKKFEDIECFVPPLSEQQRIVAKIEELFSILDKIKKALEAWWHTLLRLLSLPIYHFVDNLLLFAGSTAQIDASGFNTFMSHKVG